MTRPILVLFFCLGMILSLSCSDRKNAQPSGNGTSDAAPAGQTQFKKYDIKSGVITYETTVLMGDTRMVDKVVVTFDDYGAKECQDKYNGGEIKESFFTDGGRLYTTIYRQKTTYLRGNSRRGVAFRVAWDEIAYRDKQTGAAKQLPKMTILGKDCDAFVVDDAGTKTTYAGWGHIMLLMDMQSSVIHSIQKAVQFEENVSVPASKFAPPEGFAVRESSI